MTTKKCERCQVNLNESLFVKNNDVCKECSKKFKKHFCDVCNKQAYFNIPNLKWGRFCLEHAKPGMIDVKHKKCIEPGCTTQPNYNYPGEKKYLYCKTHAKSGMVNIKNKTCIEPGCGTRPSYNNPNEKKGIYCKTHAKPGMIDVLSNKCIEPGCGIYPLFNNPEETSGLYCKTHAKPGMINVESKKCIEPGCNTRPSYNIEGEKTALYCKEHAKKDMISVTHKTCLEQDCTLRPSFNNPGEKIGIYCKEHSKPGMVDVENVFCIESGCGIYPSFNYIGEKVRLYCKTHAKPGMITLRQQNCLIENCTNNANYGYCGNSVTHCYEHKLPFMLTNPKKTCIGNEQEKCKDIAVYGINEPLHCEDHKSEDEICWLVKPCTKCKRTNELLDKEGLCYFICSLEKLDLARKNHEKVKESIMILYLRNNIILSDNIKELPCDKIVNKNCNLYRPDLPYDCSSHILVIECDENQHKNYNWESCISNKSLEHAEEKRMYEIMIAYEGKPIIFLRYNPDSFSVKGKTSKKYTINKRLEILKKWVEYCMKLDISEISGLVQYKKLFYDEYEEKDISFKVINEKDLL